VVEQGRRAGVKTPFNDKIVALFHEHGVGFAPALQNLEPLTGMTP
jgi:hypothetical protein